MVASPTYDIAKLKRDMAKKGWLPRDLARQSGLSDMTVSRFLRGLRANPRTARRLAEALGHRVDRYLVAETNEPAVSA